jgi:hypothetical protein
VELTHRIPLNAFIKERTFYTMVNWKTDSVKVHQGLAKCPSCEGFYDPTYGSCPCQRRFYVALFAAVVALLLLAWPNVTGAQSAPTVTPYPSPTYTGDYCIIVDGQVTCFSGINDLTPLPTAPPTPTATPTPYSVYLSLILED